MDIAHEIIHTESKLSRISDAVQAYDPSRAYHPDYLKEKINLVIKTANHIKGQLREHKKELVKKKNGGK